MNMALARLGGATYKQIGEEFGLTRQRANQILNRLQLDRIRHPILFGHGLGDKKKLPWPIKDATEPYVQQHYHYFPPGERAFKEPSPLRSFRGRIGKLHRRKDVEMCRALAEQLGRLPYMMEVAKARFPDISPPGNAGPIMTAHWVSRRKRTGKYSYRFYRDRMYIAAFGWGTKAPDGRSFTAAQARKEQRTPDHG
jgi:hypothetical protein